MSAMARENPSGFDEALKAAAGILAQNHELVRRGLVATEAEQLVTAAYRRATGQALTRMELFSRMKDRYPDEAGHALLVMALRRAQGTLLQHITGVQVFLDHEYEVSPEVLIPRPETEVLATIAVRELTRRGAPTLGLEVGLGSGILSIELLARFPGLSMIASELSEGASALALRNATRILGRTTRLRVIRSDRPEQVLEPLRATLDGTMADFIVSNPPYLAKAGEAEADVVAQEPALALFAPENDLLHFYRRIAEEGRSVLRAGGMGFLELAAERATEIEKLFSGAGWLTTVHPDLNGRPRVLVVTGDW